MSKGSKIWIYFVRKTKETAECKKCHKTLKCCGGSTSSMSSHVKNIHGININKINSNAFKKSNPLRENEQRKAFRSKPVKLDFHEAFVKTGFSPVVLLPPPPFCIGATEMTFKKETFIGEVERDPEELELLSIPILIIKLYLRVFVEDFLSFLMASGSQPRRKELTLRDKLELLKQYDRLPKMGQRAAALQLNISQPHLCKLLKNRTLIEERTKLPGYSNDRRSRYRSKRQPVSCDNYDDGTVQQQALHISEHEPLTEICEEENSQSNTQSSSDRRSHQSSPTPSMIGPYLLKKETHCTTILDQLLRDDTFSDVTLTAEGQSIRAHKIVFMSKPVLYFRQVLSKKESNVQNVKATVDAADLESFMKTAEMLEVTSLCDGHRNFPKNLLPKTKESESEKVPSSTPSKTFPATKRSHAFSSAASNGSPPTKSRKTDAKDTSKKSSLVLPHPSTSGGGGGTSCPNDSIIEPTATIIKTEPVSEDSVAEEDYELKVGTDVSFESLTRSPPPPPLAAQNQVSTDLGENQSSLPDQSACSSTSLEKVPVGKCPLCPSSQPIRKGSELTKHLYAHHPDKTVFCCESCSRVFLKKGSFEAHKKDCNR
ncbi:Protein bric-a-brac 1 [Armadillidium vulgare]|nr:Protein bric-a-brac 1 [Armadillidium vulgare]